MIELSHLDSINGGPLVYLYTAQDDCAEGLIAVSSALMLLACYWLLETDGKCSAMAFQLTATAVAGGKAQ